MSIPKRYEENPILHPLSNSYWERVAVFNGCPIKVKNKTHLFYRAISDKKYNNGVVMNVSSIGHAESSNGKLFQNRTQLIKPSEEWDKYGCEDPRVTKLGNKYYIFYTALSRYPFTPDGIKIGVAVTKDFKNYEKYPVTTFNSKAMSLFPEKIKGKMTAILTANTDMPPAKIAIATFNKESDLYSKRFWNDWYKDIDKYKVDFNQKKEDHIELGAPPIKIKEGWLLVYSYIKDYFSPNSTVFEIKAVLLDKNDPTKIIGRTDTLLKPTETYEIYGQVPNIVFPSGAFIKGKELHIYYGAADTICCGAKFKLKDIIKELTTKEEDRFTLKRYRKNPILAPTENPWEKMAVYNAGAIYLDGKFHIVYRAQATNGRSVLGYASTKNGCHIDERLSEPIYVPRADFEIKNSDGNSGCEDPRLILFEGKIYMFYTAYDGNNPPRIALTSITKKNFLNKKWDWAQPKLISSLKEFNKNACIFPERINSKIIALHRMNNSIDIDFLDDLSFTKDSLSEENNWVIPRKGMWDSQKVGITGAPIKTKHGWILIYHGVSDHRKYRLGALLLDLKNPEKIIARTENPILEPKMPYEINGQVPNVVFSCGVARKHDTLHIFYGGADSVLCVATVAIKDLIRELKNCIY